MHRLVSSALLFFLVALAPLKAQDTAAILLDTNMLKEMVAHADPVPLSTLLENEWVHKQSIIQYHDAFDEGPLYEVKDEMEYVYHFKEDGTYWIDAILDTDGTWSYDGKAKTFSIKSNFRSYISHSGPIIYENGVLKWYEVNDPNSKYWTIIVYVMEPKE